MRKHMFGWSFLVSLVAVCMLSTVGYGQVTKYDEDQRLATEAHAAGMSGHAVDAKSSYRRYCAGCHGDIGDGNGENTPYLDPKPRNFTLGQFKCRSTPTGSLPTDEDLYATIARGIENSNMPPWNPLSAQARIDLVAYVKHFSPKWTSEKPGIPIQIPAAPEVTAESVKAGQVLFQRLECWKCHGVEGRANGPSSDTLQDDQNRPILPFNFTQAGRFKCGSSDADLYKIFMTGLDGTPMPSFADNVKPEEAWELVFYLRTLQPKNEYNTKEKEIARQLGLKPINPNIPLPAPAPAAAPSGQ